MKTPESNGTTSRYMTLEEFEKSTEYGDTPKIRAYCENCGETRPFFIDPMKTDELNPVPWGDMVCWHCYGVITTLSTDEPGNYQLTKIDP